MAKIAKVETVGTEVVWNWSDGKETRVDVTSLPENMVLEAAMHGIKQKGSDCYAGAKENGWSVADCRDLTEEVLGAIRDGQWNRKATGTGGIIVEAIAELTGKELDEVRAFYKGLDEEKQKALAKDANVKAKVAELKAIRAAQAAKGEAFTLEI